MDADTEARMKAVMDLTLRKLAAEVLGETGEVKRCSEEMAQIRMGQVPDGARRPKQGGV